MKTIEEVIALREISIFVSSTFEDLKEERDYLSRIIFPAIKTYAQRRDVSFQYIDLRWGITQAESRAHGVLKACMNEIDRSHPFFIGIVGDRYGWQPTWEDFGNDVNDVLGRAPWMEYAVQKGTSITEIEFLYGALAKGFNTQNAWFYVKEIEVHDTHLKALIKKLDDQNQFPVKRFKLVKELGDMILCDIQGKIDELYEEEDDFFAKEFRRNEYVLSDSMAKIVDFPEHVYHRLYEWVSDTKNNCAAIYSSGKTVNGKYSRIVCGKSMLLCHYVSKLREKGRAVAYFDCGTSKGDTLTLCREYVRRFIEMQQSSEKIFFAIDNITRTVIGNVDNLAYLINEYSEKCRFILSTNYGELVMKLTAQSIDCPLLSYATIDKLIDKYMGLYGKKLENDEKALLPHHGGRLDELKRILDHLVRFGSFERLSEEIRRYKKVGWETNFNLISALKEEMDSVENGYANCISILNAIFVTGDAGLSEEEILCFTNISSMRWAIIRERILELCKRNGPYYTIEGSCRSEMETVLRDMYFTNYRDLDIIRIIAWLTEHPIPFPRMAIMLDSLYNYFLGVIKDEEQIKAMERGRISLYRDVDLVNEMDFHILINAWNSRLFADEKMNDWPLQWTGFKTKKQHTSQEMYTYYSKMFMVAYNLGRIDECTFFGEKLRTIDNNSCEAMLRQIGIFIRSHHFQAAVGLYEQSMPYDNSFKVRAGLMIAKELLRRGYLDECFNELDKLKALAANLPNENLLSRDILLLDIELNLLVCYFHEDIEEGKLYIGENILPMLQNLLDMFITRGWSDSRLWKVTQLIGLSNMIMGHYDFAMHNWLNQCMIFAANIMGQNSPSYAQAMLIYGLGFTCVDAPKDYSSDHIRQSNITHFENDDIIDVWTINAMCMAMRSGIRNEEKDKIANKLKSIMKHIREASEKNSYHVELFDEILVSIGCCV